MRPTRPTSLAYRVRAVTALSMLCAAAWAGPASAVVADAATVMTAAALAAPQSESELRQTNQRQEQRIRQLEAELAAALERIRQLEAQLAAPHPASPGAPAGAAPPSDPNAPAAPPGGAPLPTGATPPPPHPAPPGAGATPAKRPGQNPFDSSAGVLGAIRARFAADFAGKPAPREDVHDDRLTRLWMNEVERWANAVNREFRRQVIWNVRVLSAENLGRAWRLEVVCVDPATRADLGEPFAVQLQQPQASPYLRSVQLGTAGEDFTLRGTFIPQVVVNPLRFEMGLFDRPPFVGPFLEYGYHVSVTSLVPVDAKRRPPSGAPANPPAPGGAPAAPPAGNTPPPGAPATSPPTGAGGR